VADTANYLNPSCCDDQDDNLKTKAKMKTQNYLKTVSGQALSRDLTPLHAEMSAGEERSYSECISPGPEVGNRLRDKQAVREAATICARPLELTFDLLSL